MQPADLYASAIADYRAGNFVRAAATLAPFVMTVPPDPAALRLFGFCQLHLGARQEALSLFTRAHDLSPQDPWSRFNLGIGLQAVGRQQDAAAQFRACVALLPDDPAPLINLATTLLATGDVSDALLTARKAVLRAPRRAEAHYTLGQARLAAGQLPRAAEAFATAVRLAPGFADAWVNLGLVRYQHNDFIGAKVAMRAALDAQPDHRTATGNLGALMRLTGEAEAAEQLLVDLVRRDPGAAEARVNLAAQLLQEERTAEALAWLDAPLPTEPRLRQHWQLQHTLAMLQCGRTVEARALLDTIGDVPAATLPLLLWRRVLLALAEGDQTQAVAMATDLQAALARGEATLPEHRIMAYYDLAKFWSRLGRPERAFPCWQHGHALLRLGQPFSRPDHLAFVDASIERFTHVRLHGGARAGNTDSAPVFIVGMPRSGTTLCEQILAAHPAVFGAGERAALGNAVVALGGGWDTPEAVARIAALDTAFLDAAAAAYLAELHALAPAAQRITDKMPGNFRHLGLVALMFPGARIIHCQRDPRDIGLSIFTFRFYGVHAYAHDLDDLGWYIGQHERLMAHWRAVLPNPILTVRLRDWVEDFPGTLRRVLAFLDLPYDPACERFHELDRPVRTVSRTQVREKVNARGLGRWPAYAQQLQPMIETLIRENVSMDDEYPHR